MASSCARSEPFPGANDRSNAAEPTVKASAPASFNAATRAAPSTLPATSK